MPTASVSDTTALGADLLKVVARLNRFATQRTQLPLPWAQARLLSTIEDRGEARISDLAELDHCSQPTMTTQVRRLEDAGLVTRTADPGDARAVLIRITEAGVDVLARARIDRAAVIDPPGAVDRRRSRGTEHRGGRDASDVGICPEQLS